MKTKLLLLSVMCFIFLINLNAARSWKQKTNYPRDVDDASGFVVDNLIYMGTGRSSTSIQLYFYKYEPLVDTWTRVADSWGGIRVVSSVGFSIGSVGYVGTGYLDGGPVTSSFWEYNPSGNTWTQKANFGGGARQRAIGFAIGTKGYIGTGIDGSSVNKKDFWEYDPTGNSWTQKTNFGGTARCDAACFVLNNKGYVGTGYDGSCKKDFWEYDPTGNSWTQKTDFGGTVRSKAVGFSVDSKGYIGTGYDLTNRLSDIWEYNPTGNSWTQTDDYGGGNISDGVAFIVGTSVYLGVGNDGSVRSGKFWVWSVDSVYPLPTKPTTPTGTTTLCQNASNTQYTTTQVINALSYVWTITPVNAGTIVNTDTVATVDWSASFYGTAKIAVNAQNATGDGPTSDTLTVTVNPLPGIPAKPTGETALCKDGADKAYSTTGATNASSYAWSLYPISAGSISGTGTTGTVNWDANYSGTAYVKVKGNNGCGYGSSSDSLAITVSTVPVKPATPTGTTALCINSAGNNYTTTGATGATSYVWNIMPVGAGVISGTSTTGAVDWGNSFVGTAKITVKGHNDCGDGVSSDSLTVTIVDYLGKPGKPSGADTVLCLNPSNSSFTTTGVTGATSYSWSISPVGAGSISGTSTTGTVNWDNAYTGTAKIIVKGNNTCGTGDASDTLIATINGVLGKPGRPSGTDTVLSLNPSSSSYTTSGVIGATSYVWVISPVGAGSISGTDTIGTVNWDDAYTGTAKIIVKGSDVCGEGLISDTLYIVISEGTGISDKNMESLVTMYPNPSHGELNLKFDGYSNNNVAIDVVNVANQSVYSEDIHIDKTSFIKNIDISSFDKGIYFVKISDYTNIKIEKLVIY